MEHSPKKGAAILFAFTLGTTPVFFSVAYFATRLGATVEKYFTRIVALVVIVLGVVSVDSGLNLAGSPMSITRLVSGAVSAPAAPAAPLTVFSPSTGNNYTIRVSNSGYLPWTLHLPANQPVSLIWVTRDVYSCAVAVVVPDLNYQTILPASGEVSLEIPAQQKGTAMHLEGLEDELPGIHQISASYNKLIMEVDFDEIRLSIGEIIAAANAIGYHPEPTSK